MVEKSAKSSSKNRSLVEIMSQAPASKSFTRSRNPKICGNEGALLSRQSEGDLAKDLSDAEVAGYLNNKKEFLLKTIAWEMMNPDYQKVKQRKPTTGKKKDPVNKTNAPSKKTSLTITKSNPESENKKRPSPSINYDILDKLFDSEPSPKKAKLDKPVLVGDQMEYSQQSSEESLLKPQDTEEEEEPDWNEDHCNEDAYGREGEFYGDANLEIEDQEEEEEYEEDIIW